MDYTATLFVTCLGLNFACTVYVISQGIKGMVWVFNLLTKDDDKDTE